MVTFVCKFLTGPCYELYNDCYMSQQLSVFHVDTFIVLAGDDVPDAAHNKARSYVHFGQTAK